MKLLSILVCWCALCASSLAQESEPSLFPAGYPDHESLSASLKSVAAKYPGLVRLRSVAKSAEGRDVWLATIGAPDGKAPAILVVGNLEADHVVGSAVSVKMIESLAELATGPNPKFGMDRVTIHVVPRLNPDGAERVLKAAPRESFRLNLLKLDRDRDGKTNEDGPDDLDGDGFATKMRIKDLKASMIPEEKDPRILKKADPAKGERGVFSEYIESLDNDGDGTIGEDPAGGVNLNRHWPHNWTEFDLEAGWSPVSEPEARGLVEFAFSHPEIAAVWTFALNDNLKDEPKKPGSTLDDADLPIVAELARQFQKLSKVAPLPAGAEKPAVAAPAPVPAAVGAIPKGPVPSIATSPAPLSLDGTTDGAMSEWAYHQFGVLGISSRLWALPELAEPVKDQPAAPADGDARWLYWNDRVMGGKAFVPFHAFAHPQLGPVEIGGWKPGVRVNPPIERLSAIADAHLAFLKDLAGRLPRLELKNAKAEAKGAGLYEVTASVVNEGFLPSALAQGVKTRIPAPVLVKLKGDGVKFLSGKSMEKIDTLAGSGASVEYRWLVLVPAATKTVTLEAGCPKTGRAEAILKVNE